MCAIIDANCLGLVFGPRRPEISTLQDAIFERQALVLVHGGQLTREYNRCPSVLKMLATIDRAGMLKKFPDADVDAATAQVSAACASDDPHIIGLARVAGARLLCSADQTLHQDFGNPALVSRPRGKVYQTNDHSRLLRTTKCARKGGC